GAPAWVAGVERVPGARRGEVLAGDAAEAVARARGGRLRALAPPRDDRPALPARGAASGPPVWVVAEMGPRGPKPVTAELLAKAAELAARLGAPVEAVVLGDGAEHAAALAAAGADRVLVAEGAALGLGLTGDAIDLDLDGEGRVRQMKPAFGGAIVAPILSRTRPEMATVRPGILRPARADPTRSAVVERLAVPAVPARVRVRAE